MVAEIAVEIPTILVGVSSESPSVSDLRPEHYLAVGDGSANDTAAFVRLLVDYRRGSAIRLRDGATYLVDADVLALPSFGDYAWNRIYSDGASIIRARTAGRFLIGSQQWTSNSVSAGSPLFMSGVILDGNGLVDHCHVVYTHNSRFERVMYRNAVVSPVLFSTLTANGTTECSTTMSDDMWIACRFTARTDAASDALFKTTGSTRYPTDFWLQGCTFDGSAKALLGIDLARASGAQVQGNHTYNTDPAGYDVYFRDLAQVGSVADNIFERRVRIGKVGTATNAVMFGPGNRLWKDLVVDFAADTTRELLDVVCNHFTTRDAEVARLVNNSDQTNKRIVSKLNTFETSTPYVRTYAASDIRTMGDSSGDSGFAQEAWEDYSLTLDGGVLALVRADAPQMLLVRSESGDFPYIQLRNDDPTTDQSLMDLRWTDDLGNTYLRVIGAAADTTDDAVTGRFVVELTEGGVATPRLIVGDTGAFVSRGALYVGDGQLGIRLIEKVDQEVEIDGGEPETWTTAFISGEIDTEVSDTTQGSEDSTLRLKAMVGGALTIGVTIGAGVQVGAPTGGAKGNGSVNTAAGVYRQNVPGMFTAGTKVTAAAPYTNDGYITVTLADGTTVKVMTTA
jgi:hypothetical protein